jgi:serine/threonine-protein kinase
VVLAPARADVSYFIDTAAGSDLVGDNGPAPSAQLANAHGIAMDRQGNLYIADTDTHRVRKITPAGIISTLAGTGHAGSSGDGGLATSA